MTMQIILVTGSQSGEVELQRFAQSKLMAPADLDSMIVSGLK